MPVMLFSVEDNLTGIGGEKINWEKPRVPVAGVWATPPVIDQHGVADVDGLEVWGPEPDPPDLPPGTTDDANRYSVKGDPGGVAVWAYAPGAPGMSTPYVTTATLQAALETTEEVDLDALMVYDVDCDDYFAPGDIILFSVRPGGPFDGGEIWVLPAGGLATPLFHGGHLWDTAFDVMGTYDLLSENVDALEAIGYTPEPTTLLLLAAGLGAIAARRRKRS
jgi:hypothetical protein